MVCPTCGSASREGARFCDSCGSPLAADTERSGPEVPGPLADGRYVARELLGVGARKDVWLAVDTRLGRDVALAMVRTAGLDDTGRLRIDREARVMARLGDHPNVVTVLDVGTHGDTPYIVSQFMGGGTLADRLDAAQDHRLGVASAVAVATAMARALDHAHRLDVIHRDIKPANVFFGADGTPQLGDFGLAAQADEARLTAEGMVVGTVSYLPPEQTMGAELDPRSDLYSLGAVLYETLTGRPPFVGENAVSVISQHLQAEPVSTRWHNSEVSARLDELVLGLLAKSPEDRPGSAAEVALVLEGLVPEQSRGDGDPQPSPDTGAEWGRFVGRERESTRLRSALDEALAGRARLVMVVGEPGIGKTRTVQELAAEAGARGARVLWGHAYEGDIGAPYLPFVDALRSFTRDLPDAQLVELAASNIAELASLLPDLHGRVPDIAALPRLDGDAERYRMYEAITSFLRSAARAQPLVLVLEDLHWADKPSLVLLQYLARSIGDDRLLVVCTYRDVDLERTHPLSDALVALRREQLYERVLLAGMSVDEVKALIDAIGGQDSPIAFAERLHTETKGNPFFVAEILQHLVETGSLRFEDGQWVGTAESIEMALPEGVRDVIGRRLDRLSPDCNSMLRVAAAMTSGFDVDTVRDVSGLDEDTVLDALDEALAARVVQERRDRRNSFDFTHALIRQTLYAELSTPRRARLHRRLLEVLEAGDADVAELAHHAFQSITAGDVDLATGYAIRAAERARDTYAHEEAARHYDMALQALDLAPDPDPGRRGEILLELAAAQINAGDGAASRRSADEAAEIGMSHDRPDLVARAALHRAQRNTPMALTEYDTRLLELCEVADRELTRTGEHSALHARVLAAQAMHLAGIDWEPALPIGTRAVEIAQATDDPLARYDALRCAGFLARQAADPDEFMQRWQLPDGRGGPGATLTWDELERRFDELRPEDDLDASWVESSGRAYRSLADGDAAERRRALEGMEAVAAESRSPVVRTRADLSVAVQAIIEGRYDDGSRILREYTQHCRAYGLETELSAVGLTLTPMLREQGHLAPLLEPTREVVERVEHPAWRGGFALLLSELGRVDELHALVDEVVIDSPEQLDPRMSIPYARAMFAEVVAAAGRVDAAQVLDPMLAADPERCIVLGGWAWYGATDRYRGLVAATVGDHDRAVECHRRAIEIAESMGSPTWAARGRLDLARALLARDRGDDRAAATAQLNDALGAATAIGMTRLVEEVTEAKLAAQGVDADVELSGSIGVLAASLRDDPPVRSAGGGGRLTLVFSDIEGYTAMNERLGDLAAHDVLRAHNAVLRRHLAAHGGTEIKSEGDGFMLTFEDPVSACRFASGFVTEVGTLDPGPGADALRVRVGIHAGEVIRDADDVFGRTVIIAARIAAIARGGEILVSSSVAAEASGAGLSLGPVRQVDLKGLNDRHAVTSLVVERPR